MAHRSPADHAGVRGPGDDAYRRRAAVLELAVRRGALSVVTWALIAAGVLAVIALSFAAPRRMLSPGPLIGGHAQLEADCFACHAPFRGAAWQRCTRCHRLP